MRGKVTSLLMSIFLILTVVPSDSVLAENVDLETLGLIWKNTEGHNATLWSVRWSPDGTMISATFFDETTTIFDAVSGEVMLKLGAHSTGPEGRCWGSKECSIGDHWPSRSSSWSPDGKYLAVGGDNTIIRIYDTSDWSIYKELLGHRGSILSVAFSPDGELIASSSGTDKVEMHNMPENEAWIWNTTTWERVAVLKGHKDGVMNAKWSPNGTRLATASDDKSIRIWVRDTWELEKILLAHNLGALDVAWSPDGKTLVSGSRDYKIRAWDYETGESTDRYSEPNCVRSVDFHPNGKFYAASGVDEVQLKVRDAVTGAVLASFIDGAEAKSDIMSSRWSPDGNFLAAGSGKESTLRVYSFGQVKDDGGGDDRGKNFLRWGFFLLVIAVVIALIMYPLRRKLREGGR